MALIPDDAVCFSSGMAGNGRCSIFFWGIRERYLRTGHPKGLTWITVGAQGGRGKVPGTLEEICLPGLLTRHIGGHVETKKALLKLVDAGQCELHTMPQGQQAFLLEAQARGEDSVVSMTAVGTFLDPRCGTGSLVKGEGRETFITPEGDALRFRLPKVEWVFFVASYADEEGNLYVRNASTLTEIRGSVAAAKRNGGKVMATVCGIIPKSPDEIYVHAEDVDAIVVNPHNEQTGSVPMRSFWPMFTVDSDMPAVEAIGRLKFLNHAAKITPSRGPVEDALARLGATVFTSASKPGALVNIGVGMPEEVCRVVFEAGLTDDVTFMSETGVLGGLPAPGVFFGAAVCPKKMMGSVDVFHQSYESLDTTILGVLQVDSEGNVNVSKRGPRALDYVGPGGLPDLTAAAKNILFVGSWQAGGKMAVQDGKMAILQRGKPKFIEHVDEVTFCGRRALAMEKNVFYATNVGVFRLTERGMELIRVMPGIDIKRDVLDGCRMRVVLPDGDVPVVDASILTGLGFNLAWHGGMAR
jgi:propionate CoA-transferase